MRRKFVTLDVFTERRFAGNPLAVVLDAQGLDQAAMQAIAREFNLPETVFVHPAADAKHRARIRIFTPANELPFAGHPTVGTAVLLACRDGAVAGELVLEEGVGPVRCQVETRGGERGNARFASPRRPAPAGPAPATDRIAAALGVSAADIGFDGYQPARWSAGLSFTFVPLRNLEAIGRCRADLSLFENAFAGDGAGRAYLFCGQTAEAGHDFHARMFAPGMGIAEDPATGSAAAAFAGLIAARRRLDDGEHVFRIEQGFEMARPSLIEIGLSVLDGALAANTVGGDAIVVSEGEIEA
jgi:trans-2,3-dihydro-3-hydroxyanthranilate isomerase